MQWPARDLARSYRFFYKPLSATEPCMILVVGLQGFIQMSSSLSSKSYQRHIIGLAQPIICCRKLSYPAQAIFELSSSTPRKRVWVVLYPMQGFILACAVQRVQSSWTPMSGSVSTVVPSALRELFDDRSYRPGTFRTQYIVDNLASLQLGETGQAILTHCHIDCGYQLTQFQSHIIKDLGTINSFFKHQH